MFGICVSPQSGFLTQDLIPTATPTNMLVKSHVSLRPAIGALFALTFSLPISGVLQTGLYAQSAAVQSTGNLSGTVVDSASGSPLRGVTITISGLDSSAQTDLNGAYFIQRVPVGTYTVTFSRSGYRTGNATDVVVSNGQTAKIDFPLAIAPAPLDDTPLIELETFTITAAVLADSDIGLLSERQKAVSISDALGSESFSRLGLGDAAQAMSKVTGASIVDGKYVYIRGLGDRYSNTLLNGVAIPSSDPDRRAVQMDIFPTSVLESIVTSKSFTPDQPGAFSGGSVNIRTKNFPDGFFATVGGSLAFNTNSFGEDILTVPGGGRDWLGRDDGTRDVLANLPNPIPDNINAAGARTAARRGDFTIAETLDLYSNQFNNETFFPRTSNGKPNWGFDTAVGDRLVFDNGQELGYIFSANYDNSNQHYSEGISNRYSLGSFNPAAESFVDPRRIFTTNLSEYKFTSFLEDPTNVPPGREYPAFGVTSSSQNIDWGSTAQLAYRFSPEHDASFRVLHSQSAEDRVKRGVGEAVRSDSGGEFRENYDLLYTERALTTYQASGASIIEALNDTKIEWRASRSLSSQDQPDYRNFEFKWSFLLREYDPSGIVQNRYFRELEDESDELGLDVTVPFVLGGNEYKIKLGGLYSDGSRTYRQRIFQIESGNAVNTNNILNYPNPVGITNRTTNSVTFGTTMREIASNSNYDGSQSISAGYLMLDAPVTSQLRFITGARLENTELETTPLPKANINLRPGIIDQRDVLPAFQVVLGLSENSNLRASYGRTLARPTFWELADVIVYEPFLDENRRGNPDLELTRIDNFDLRWEWFPRGGEIVALSIFYKKLENPIEVLYTDNAFLPQNVEEGAVSGIEFEFRRYLSFLSDTLENTSFGLNAALINSKVTIPERELADIRTVFPDTGDTRELYGQSPYTLNIDITQEVPNWGSTFTLALNIVGERLDLVNPGPLPDVYEQPAPSLDFLYSQRIGDKWKLKFAAKNILNPDFEKTIEHNGRTYFWESYTKGITFSIGASYDF